MIVLSTQSWARGHVNKEVLTIHSPDSRPCTFFKLKSVAEADSSVPTNPWFAVPTAHNGHDVIVSMLLAAFMSGKKVNVSTTGGVECGHAAISNVHFSH